MKKENGLRLQAKAVHHVRVQSASVKHTSLKCTIRLCACEYLAPPSHLHLTNANNSGDDRNHKNKLRKVQVMQLFSVGTRDIFTVYFCDLRTPPIIPVICTSAMHCIIYTAKSNFACYSCTSHMTRPSLLPRSQPVTSADHRSAGVPSHLQQPQPHLHPPADGLL